MDEKERELRQRLAAKLEEARRLMAESKMEEARSATSEAKQLREQIDLLKELRDTDTPGATVPVEPEARGNQSGNPAAWSVPSYRSAFLKVLRNRPLTGDEQRLVEEVELEVRAGMQGGVGEDGGLIVPQDIQTMIHELKREFVSLEPYVTVEPVSTRSGSRVIEKNADITPFAEITEMTDIGDLDNPKFKPLAYTIKDRGGILPISNTLLNDTDQNLMQYIARWIAKKSVVTRNKLILDKLAALTRKPIANLDSIKKILNVDLDPNIALNAIILTNQDGFNYLDNQKDADGKDLLQPDPTQPSRKLLKGKPIVVLANRWLPSTGTTTKKAPIYIGDLKEFIVLFDRQQYSITSTNVGGKSFGRNTTDVRAIQREDLQLFDDEAVIAGEITLP
ncbi:phage major capsid protein [Paenibacillus sp. OV219]|uniref:phage major capsid protein n=1 Tax=Paenibacillus sp. OV219 TaxID=1884377 RepID=UPI0008C82DF1|nr:phage major capsid protein [Paenibacillus sp. OV219]SEM81562.1 phage major capsid protein, HK97 family [Paenibacillus sp. OV219]